MHAEEEELTPLIASPKEDVNLWQKVSACCVSFYQHVMIFLTYFSVIVTLPLSILVCVRFYEDNYITKVTRFGAPVKPWTCLLRVLDVYFVLPIDRVEKIWVIENPKLQIGPFPCILTLRDGVKLRLFWSVRLLSTTKFPGALSDSPRQALLSEVVEMTMRRFSARLKLESMQSVTKCREMVLAVANRLKSVLQEPPFPSNTIHHFDVQVGRLVPDSLGRAHYFQASVHSPIMTVDDKVPAWG